MDIITTRRTKVEKGYELLADITVGTATTSVDITGLNIGKGDEVVLVAEIYNPTLSESKHRIYVNGIYTDASYYSQLLSVEGGGTLQARYNYPAAFMSTGIKRGCSVVNIKLTNSGYFVFQSNVSMSIGGNAIGLAMFYGAKTSVDTSLTSFRISDTTNPNAIGIGSRFQLYKIGGA